MAEETRLDFRILGDLEVWRGDVRVDVGSPRRRALLAILLLHRNRIVSSDRLTDLLWGERPPATAANTLHVLVSGLRRALRGDGADSPVLTRRPGYELPIDDGQVDVDRFVDLRDAGLAAAGRGDHEAAARDLRRALVLWRGDPLPELCDVVDLAGELAQLRELRLTTVEALIDAELALGRHHAAVAELEALVEAEPLRERLRAQLMLALYRSGRQARALEVYRLGRRRLVDELGVEPGPALRELQLAILRQDASVGPVTGPWERPASRNRRFAAVAGVVLAALACIALVVWHTGTPAASRAASPPTAVTLLDAQGTRVRSSLPAANAVAAQPDGSAWVANTAAGTITRVSVDGSRRVAGVGGRPTDVAWGFGMVWVGDAPGRRVIAYDPRRRTVALRVPLPGSVGPVGQPAAHLAVGAGSVWVDTGGLAGVLRIDPSGTVRRIRNVQTGAITFGMGAVWVAGDFFSSDRVDRIDPHRNALAGSIPLPSGGPVSIAAAGGWLWVVCDDGTLWRIDVATRRVARVPIPGEPVAVSASGTKVWVAATGPNRVIELDATAVRRESTIALSGEPTATATAGDSAWVTTVTPVGAEMPAAPPGVVTVALNTGIDSIDPAVAQSATAWQLEYATGLRLLTYRDRSWPAGDQLVPDAAAAMPRVSNGGRAHTFTLRRGLRFWPGGEPVTADAFRAAVERGLSPRVASGFGLDFMSDLSGVRAFRRGRAAHVSGIRLLGRYRISVRTVTPDPAFDVDIAMPTYAAVPPGTPDVRATRPLPSAGPYYIAAYDPGRLIILRRNPGYRGPRPAGSVEIRYLLGGAGAESAWQQVADGHADVDADPATPTQLASLRAKSARLHVRIDPAPVIRYLLFNTRSPAMGDPRVRRAVSEAIDRAALAATIGPGGATPTDQYLAPGVSGYPGENGRVEPLDRARPAAARRLLNAAGVRRGLTLRLSTCDDRNCVADGAPARVTLLRAELAHIGIRLLVLNGSRQQQFQRDLAGDFDVADEGFIFPTSDPADLDFPISVEGRFGPTPAMRRAERAPYPHRADAWRALELALDRGPAPLAAYAIDNTITLTSPRVGCVVVQPEYGLDLGRLCLDRQARSR